jgi:hypothetical protein
MNRNYQYTTINHPNLAIPKQETTTQPFGYYLDFKGDDENSITGVKIQDMYLPNFSIRISEGELEREGVFVNTSAEGLDLFGTCLFLKGNVKTSVNKHKDGMDHRISSTTLITFLFTPHLLMLRFTSRTFR